MKESQAREEICRVGKSLFDRGYVHATAGNISVRLDDALGGFLITPGDACLGFLDPGRLSKLDGAARQVSGDRASKTIALHAEIYRASLQSGGNPRCVIHTHSTHCVAATLGAHQAELLAPLTPYFVMKVGRVPVIPYHRPGDPDAARRAGEVIIDYAGRGLPLRALMFERLGPNVWHDTPAAAMATLEELEETARLHLLAGGVAQPLDESRIEELRRGFGAVW
jgi:3-dehydro-4-phosphotetronate decarboxylase